MSTAICKDFAAVGREAINGELHLTWTTSLPAAHGASIDRMARAAIVQAPEHPSTAIDAEDRIEQARAQLSPDARAALAAKLTKPVSFDAVAISPSVAVFRGRPARAATVRVAADPEKAQRDLDRGRALCSAFAGKLPGQPEACASLR